MRRKGGFFARDARPEDAAARQNDVATLLAPRRTAVQDIPVDRIRPNPFQARRDFSDIGDLAQVIRAHGFTTRLRVRPDPAQPGFFQLVFGERRLRAAIQAGMDAVPCEIADHTDEELIEIGLAENIQRRDLKPLEEAQAFAMLIKERGYSVRRLAERLGKDKSYVEDRLALLRAPAEVQQMVAQRPDALRAAREIAKLDSPSARAALIASVLAGDLSTQDVRALVRKTTTLPARNEPQEIQQQFDFGALVRKATTSPSSPPHAQSGGESAPAPVRGDRNVESAGGPSPAIPTEPAQAPTAPAGDVQRIIARDARTMRTIIERWRALVAQDIAARAVVADHAEAVLAQFQRLVEDLERTQ
ncbi:MAG: ParB/RepB/Spo0J family partition protein [Roseiflexaceae bacterium]|nr:ParB/RepB/Spo0J family partition protein [Roseiflexaceae bacterium]